MRKSMHVGAFAILILGAVALIPSTARAEILFQEGFESGGLGGWWIMNVVGDPCYAVGQIEATTEDTYTGTYSAKFANLIGDPCTYMESRPGFSRRVGHGEDLYVRFRLKYSMNHEWTSENKTAEIRGDMLSRDDGARVIFSLTRRYEGGPIPIPASIYRAVPQLIISANDDAKQNGGDGWRPANSPDGDNFEQNIATNDPVYIATGRWYTVDIYIRPDAAGNGIVRMWIDGRLIMEHSGLYTLSRAVTTQAYDKLYIGGTFNQPPEGNYIQTESAHYFDDIMVSDQLCGTAGGCDTLAPAAPTNLTVQ